jgi:hypothetical protein
VMVKKLRDAAGDLEKGTRVMMATLMNIHSTPMHESEYKGSHQFFSPD